LCIRAIQEPIFSVANTDFEGDESDHGYGDCIFLVIYAQPSHTCTRVNHADLKAGAVLKKINILDFGSPGLKTHVLKEHSFPAPVLEGEGHIYNIFGVRAFLNFGGVPENTQNDVFLGVLVL
jgi:hypothetical protein